MISSGDGSGRRETAHLPAFLQQALEPLRRSLSRPLVPFSLVLTLIVVLVQTQLEGNFYQGGHQLHGFESVKNKVRKSLSERRDGMFKKEEKRGSEREKLEQGNPKIPRLTVLEWAFSLPLLGLF